MEISNEKIAKVFAQYYPCRYNNGIDNESRELRLSSIDTLAYCKITKPKLILKPLSAITDEDAIEVAKIYFDDEKELLPPDGVWIIEEIIIKNKTCKYKRAILIYQYLQSKGYDLPNFHLEGKTLHEVGLAIYETDKT